MTCHGVLGGSWVVISGVISPVLRVINIVILLITLLITNHEPPSKTCVNRWKGKLLAMKHKSGSSSDALGIGCYNEPC